MKQQFNEKNRDLIVNIMRCCKRQTSSSARTGNSP